MRVVTGRRVFWLIAQVSDIKIHLFTTQRKCLEPDQLIEVKIDEVTVNFGNDRSSEDDLFSKSDKESDPDNPKLLDSRVRLINFHFYDPRFFVCFF